ncbi:hypothetical protein RHGRI_006241 [Rhododendron griersonianum]|uniref:J domain-containing protein n=1 Tax=Rhododendron griersonianum TaxID=479676 RepID=A0AAV6KU26_9ERIC|nr:hypothetical protein RHGRI_006241 [Rhododendron griersonianum]
MAFIAFFLLLLALCKLPSTLPTGSALDLSDSTSSYSSDDALVPSIEESYSSANAVVPSVEEGKKPRKKPVTCTRNPKSCKKLSKHHSCCFRRTCVNLYSSRSNCGSCGHVSLENIMVAFIFLREDVIILIVSWRNGFEESDSFSSEESSWSRREFGAKDSKRGSTSTKGSYSTSRSSFHFCDDDNDYETIFFRSAFGGNRFGGNRSFYWSFIEEDFPNQWQSSSGHQNNYRTSWNWRHGEDEDYDSSTESDSSETDLVSYRLVLGLSPSGPLKLDDVKNAYRTCALKWHPDRHQGSSKAVAEEKFKACSAAYESLCDKMALN